MFSHMLWKKSNQLFIIILLYITFNYEVSELSKWEQYFYDQIFWNFAYDALD